MSKLKLDYYRSHDTLSISRDLLGKYLMSDLGGELTGGMITETEGYLGAGDKACHAYGGRRTPRTETMFSAGGVAYVYLCYGIHHLLNVVVGERDDPHAILIRAIVPEEGVETIFKRRGGRKSLTGPGTVTQGLGITTADDGVSLVGDRIWIEDRGVAIPEDRIETGPRIGVAYAEEDALLPYRFRMR